MRTDALICIGAGKAEAGPLPSALLAWARTSALGEERLLNPTLWSVR